MWLEIEQAFRALCVVEQRVGVIATAPLAGVHLLPEQAAYLRRKLAVLSQPETEITAISIGIAYRHQEVEAIPDGWTNKQPAGSRWNEYAAAYDDLNRSLDRVSHALAETFGGVAEGATLGGLASQVTHVAQYFPLCVSHRAVAAAASLGWRGLHGLIVTPEFGPALRLASVFLPGRIEAPPRPLPGCGACRDCLDVCPVLRKGTTRPDLNVYREMCRRRINALALNSEVCGICVRRCWQVVVPSVARVR